MLRDCSDIFKLIEACMDEAREKMRDVEPLHARIAELEAKNKTLRDAVQKFVDYDSTYHRDKEKMMLDYEVAIAAARAALNGEKL